MLTLVEAVATLVVPAEVPAPLKVVFLMAPLDCAPTIVGLRSGVFVFAINAVDLNLVGVCGPPRAPPAADDEEDDVAFDFTGDDFESAHSHLLMESASAASLLDLTVREVSRSELVALELESAQNFASVR